MKHVYPAGPPPTPDELRELVRRYREHRRAGLGGSRECLGCGSSARDAGRWWFTNCDSAGITVDGPFHHHLAKPYGCGGPDESCAEPERSERLVLTWVEVRELLARDQLALSL
jgi:hypothetical protein